MSWNITRDSRYVCIYILNIFMSVYIFRCLFILLVSTSLASCHGFSLVNKTPRRAAPMSTFYGSRDGIYCYGKTLRFNSTTLLFTYPYYTKTHFFLFSAFWFACLQESIIILFTTMFYELMFQIWNSFFFQMLYNRT